MSRNTAPSLWLPGFQPDSTEPSPMSWGDFFPAAPSEYIAPTPELPIGATCLQVPESNPAAHAHATAWRVAKSEKSPIVRVPWPTLTRSTFDVPAGVAAKFEANASAIELLRRLEAEQRAPSDDERRQLLRFSGWGGIPAAFNLDNPQAAWLARAQYLQGLLSDEDYEAARASVTSSHYTEIHVIEALWLAVERLGFMGGRVLEPAAGIGHFIGAMPREIAERSTVCAVEIDRIAGRLLHALYAPFGVDVQVAPFEKLALPENWFDLVIGNVPFGNHPAADAGAKPYARFRIHNYFIARALDLVRPGGLVCLITSHGTLDARHDAVREYLASQAHLLGAIRLPQGSFANLGGTQAQADVLFLRKRLPGEVTTADWLELSLVPESMRTPGCRPFSSQINAWYVNHPAHCIGTFQPESNGYDEVATAVFEGDLDTALRQRIELLPAGSYQPSAQSASVKPPPLAAAPGERPGSYRLYQGRVHRVDGKTLVDLHARLNATQRSRITGLCAIRDHARDVLKAQVGSDDEGQLKALRGRLNAAYDRFVARHGCLSTRANALAFRRDPDYPLLLSLEHYDEETGRATKAALFTQRTVFRASPPETVAEPPEALAASMQWKGRVDPDYMAGLLGATATEVLDTLSEAGQVFLDPADGLWKTADEYLSGPVREKLKQARLSGNARNIAALERVQPEDLLPAAIEPRLGAVWIPAGDVEAFLREVVGVECTVAYSPRAGAWSVGHSRREVNQNVKATQEWGTSRMSAVDLVLAALNVQMPTIRDFDSVKDRYVVNPSETVAAREKQSALKERFSGWAFEDTTRRERLCRLYNDLFNATRSRRFDGSHLTLPGFSRCFELHPSQRDAVWRIVQSGNTGLFHAVGAGKTAVCVIASMEMRRLGFLAKPVHVVPNHMLAQYTAEFVRLYPQASVLMATKEDLEGDRRRELVSRIATGNWDAVVLTHSSFERIRLSPDFVEGYIREVVAELEMAVRMQKHEGGTNRIVKQIEAMKKNWQARLERLAAERKKDDLLTWEQLGIDGLFVDEAHLFKNLFRYTKMTRVAGLPMTSSERAFDLYVKTQYTICLHGRPRGVVLATATPVANTMAEIHTMQRFLQPQRLMELGLEQFDAWAATFGESVTALEISPDGAGYRMNTRFARFINVPELMAIFGEVADIRTAEMLALPVPKLRGGKPRVVACPRSPALKTFVESLVERAKNIRSGTVKPSEDNMLAVTTDGRKAALDFRLVESSAAFDTDGKVAACTREILRIWQATHGFKGTQLVFCDLSSPKDGKQFSVYDDLRERLVAAGIPAKEIAFIHDADTDAKKATLFKAVRDGNVRVLIGSTAKMGLSTNVQTRLVALHHLDAPWRPCDVEQRDGRILRQGNDCEEVEILRYVTEGSFDAYLWQTLETKARFIAQVMNGDQGLRSLEDVELVALSYAEVKALASGNPLVVEKAGVDAEVVKLATLFSLWRNQRWANESELGNLPLTIDSLEARVADHEADLMHLRQQTPDGIELSIGRRSLHGKEDVGEALRELVKDARVQARAWAGSGDRIVGRFGGFELGITSGRADQPTYLYLQGKRQYAAAACQNAPTLVTALLDALASVKEQLERMQQQLLVRRKRLADLHQEMERPFEHEARLSALMVRQRELARSLDLDKNEAGTGGLESEEQPLAA